MNGWPRFATIFVLNAIEYSAISLTYAAVPVVLRANGAPLEALGYFGTLIFAFVICLVWAPVVDRFQLTVAGRRKSWIGITQFLTAVLIAGLAMLDASAQSVWTIFAMCFAIAIVAATQRIAVLGYMAENLKPRERGYGATAAGTGGAVGHLIGGAFALFLIEQLGWQTALNIFAGVIALCGVAVAFVKEPEQHIDVRSQSGASWSILNSRRVWLALLLLAPASMGLAAAYAMSEPRLVDLGFGLTEVGLVAGLANLATFVCIGPLTSIFIRDREPMRAVSLILLVSALAFALAATFGFVHPTAGGVVGIVVIFAAFSAKHVAITSFFMSLARPNSAGTDLTALSAGQSLLAMPGFIASGYLAASAGHQAPVLLAVLGCLISGLVASCLSSRFASRLASSSAAGERPAHG